MSAVLFLHGDSAGDVLGSNGRALSEDFAAAGYTLHSMAVNDPLLLDTVSGLLADGLVFAFGYAGIGSAIRVGDASLWALAQVPFFSLYGDSPAYFFDLHAQQCPWQAGLYGYADHLALRRSLPARAGTLGVAHTMTIPFPAALRAGLDRRQKRAGKLIFLKNGNDPTALMLAWQRELPTPLALRLLALAEVLMARLDAATHAQILALLDAALEDLGLDPQDLLKPRLFLLAQLDDFVRRVKSQFLANVLLDYPTEIHGFHWSHLKTEGRVGKVVLHADYGHSNFLIRDALALIDMSPNTLDGFHDRQQRAIGARTLCMTNRQPHLAEMATEAERFQFDFREDSLRGRIEWALSDPDAVLDLGEEVAERYRARYPFAAFIDGMVEMSGLIRLKNAAASPLSAQNYLIWPPRSF